MKNKTKEQLLVEIDKLNKKIAQQESDNLSKQILESMADGFSVLDENGVHLNVNRAFCNMTGFTKKELIGTGPPHPYWPEEEYNNIQKAFVKTLQGNFSAFELVFKKKNEKRFPVLVTPAQLKDEKENIIRNFATIVDITERKRIDEKLRESEEKYKGLFDESLVTVYLFDNKMNFIDSNKAGLELLGYSKKELLSLNVHDMDVDPIVVQPSHEQLISGKRIINLKHKLKKKNGSIITVLNNSRPITDVDGNMTGIQSTLIDITEREQATKKIAQATKEWQSTYDATNDTIWIIDNEHHVLQSNKAAEHLFHKSREELIGKYCYEIVHCTKEPIPECPLQHMKNSLKRETMELQIGEKWFIVTVDPIMDENNKLTSAVHVIRDITERKQIEEDIKKYHKELEIRVKERTKELEEKNAELDKAMKVFVGRELTIRKLQERIRAIEGKD